MSDDLRTIVFESLESAADNDFYLWIAEHKDAEIAVDMLECGGVPEGSDLTEVEKYVDEWKRAKGIRG